MKTFRDYLNEEYEEGDTEKLIKSIKNPQKKKMVMYYYRKMVRDEMPEDLIYDNIKELIKKGIQTLAQRTEFNNIEREDEDEELDEDPKEILDSIKNREIKKMAKFYYDNMKRDRAPNSAILDMMKDFKNETHWQIPNKIKTQKTKKENKVSPPKSIEDLKGKLKADVSIGDYEKYLKEKDEKKENKDAALKGNPNEVNASYHIRGNNDKMTKEQQFKEKVNMILRGIQGYRTKTKKDIDKEKSLYDFEDLKEKNSKTKQIEKTIDGDILTFSRRLKKAMERIPKSDRKDAITNFLITNFSKGKRFPKVEKLLDNGKLPDKNDFENLNEEYIKGTELKNAALKVKKITDKFSKKNYIAICRQVANEFGLNANDVIAAYKRLVK